MTNSRFVSVKKSDPQFQNYLLGISESGIRPIPVRSLNVGLEDEIITFEMKNLSEIKKPNIFKIIFSIAKIKSFLLIFLPLFFVLAKNLEAHQAIDPLSMIFAVIAMIFICDNERTVFYFNAINIVVGFILSNGNAT